MTKGSLRQEALQKTAGSLERWKSSWNDELCAEHDGTIASFERLGLKLRDIHEYEEIFVRDTINYARAAKYAGYTATGVLSAAALVASGGGAAPIAGALGKMGLLGVASTGTAISTLSGAALSSASLAAIGGSVATGALVVSAVGAALGGAHGAVVAQRYHSDDPSFAIRRLFGARSENRTIVINGFLSQENENFSEWVYPHLEIDHDQTIYGVNWSSKSRKEIFDALSNGTATQSAIKFLEAITKTAKKAAANPITAPAQLLDAISSLLGNPWHVSMVRAAQAGIQLAEAIARTEGKRYTLVGHSLGCRAIYYALEALSTKSSQYVSNVVLLGAAVGRDDEKGWKSASSAVSGTIFNCHSSNDSVLNVLYRTANAGLSEPAGLRPIKGSAANIVNIDCTDLVAGHSEWVPNYKLVIERIRGEA